MLRGVEFDGHFQVGEALTAQHYADQYKVMSKNESAKIGATVPSLVPEYQLWPGRLEDVVVRRLQ